MRFVCSDIETYEAHIFIQKKKAYIKTAVNFKAFEDFI